MLIFSVGYGLDIGFFVKSKGNSNVQARLRIYTIEDISTPQVLREDTEIIHDLVAWSLKASKGTGLGVCQVSGAYVKGERVPQARLKKWWEGTIALGVKPAIGSQLAHGGRGLLISQVCYTVKLQFGQVGALEPRSRGNSGALEQRSTEPGRRQNSRDSSPSSWAFHPLFYQAVPSSLACSSTLDLGKYDIASRGGYNLNLCTHKSSSQGRGWPGSL